MLNQGSQRVERKSNEKHSAFRHYRKDFSEDIDGKDEYEMESMAVNSQSKVMGSSQKRKSSNT